MDTFLRLRKKYNFHKIKLTYHSLGKMSLIIIGLFLAAAFIWNNFFPSDSDSRLQYLAAKDYKKAEKEIVEKLKKNPNDARLWRLLVDLRAYVTKMPVKINIEDVNPLYPEGIEGGRQEFFLTNEDFLKFLDTAESPKPEMLKLRFGLKKSKKKPEIKFHNKSPDELEEIGLIFYEEGEIKKAMEVFYLYLDQNDKPEIKQKIFNCLTILKQEDEIAKLLEDPDWRPHASNYSQYKYYLKSGNYPKMLYYLTLSQYEMYTWKAYLACAVAGLGWVFFLVHLGSGWFWKRKEQLLIPAALILGFFSTIFCLGVVVVQDHFLQHTEAKFYTGNIIYNLAYCVLGISLREELCKLIFFLPLLFFLKNIREEYKILCYCSLVGLGFSIEENIGYFMSYGDQVIMGRFLTANFAHTMLTGFTCFYLVKAVQQGGRAWDEFTTTFLKMIAIHGIYDFFLIDPTMVEKGFHFFAMMLYVYVAMLYLRLLMSTAPPAHQFVSLNRVFTLALCFMIGIVLLLSSSEIGIKFTLKTIFAGIIANAIYAYMFYREINEPIG